MANLGRRGEPVGSGRITAHPEVILVVGPRPRYSPAMAVLDERRPYRKPTNGVASLNGQCLLSGAARSVCDSEFVGQPGQLLVRCPEGRIGDNGGSEQMRIDPPNTPAVQLV